MARIRSIKPDFWTDGTMVSLSVPARLFYIGTWNFALCDRGHLPDDPVGLKLRILPADDVDARAIVEELIGAGRLVRRTSADGRTYLFIPRLADHQKIDARWQSRCPHCASEESSGYTEDSPNLPETPASSSEPAETPPTSPQDRKGGDGIGGDGKGEDPREPAGVATAPPVPTQEPPPRCPKHLDNPDPPPCHACGAARRALDEWHVGLIAFGTAAAVRERQQHARERADASRLAIIRCGQCDETGYLPSGALCPHDPGAANRARTGAAAARAALSSDRRTA